MNRVINTLKPLYESGRVSVIRQTGRNQVYFGVGAVNSLPEIMEKYKERDITKFTILTSEGAKDTYLTDLGVWDVVEKAFADNGMEYVHYGNVSPNPNHYELDEAVALGETIGSQAILAIGGGSPIDAGKMTAALMKYPGRTGEELVDYDFVATDAVPIVCINTTAGTGTEADQFAVISNAKTIKKPVFASDAFYPEYAIDDPALMTGLPREQTLYTALDAVNHVNEAATTGITSPYTMTMARETIDLVSHYLPIALEDPKDLEARYMLHYASMIAGIAFDNSLLHLTHVLEHTLSALKPELAHANGLCMLMPAVDSFIYPERGEILAELYRPVFGDRFTGAPEEAEEFGKALEQWLFDLGIDQKLSQFGFTEEDIPLLVEQTQIEGLGGILTVSPKEASLEDITNIYKKSMDFYK